MKVKPYPEYKDSGVEWIGEIPVSWGIFKLKHMINEFISGGTPNSDNEKFWVQDEEDGIPWVAIGDMTNNEVVMDTKKKITLDGLANKRLRILKSGTLIYSIFASLGKVSLLGIDATTNQAILGLVTNEKIDDMFLKYYLRYLEQPVIALSNANTQNNLNSTIVRNIEFSLTNDFNDQKKIASFLDKKTSEIDLTIEKYTRLIELLKEKRTALINHVVTKGLDPTAEMKDSGVEWIGEIPEDWGVKKLKHTSLVSSVKLNKKPKELPYIGLEHIQSGNGVLIENNVEEVDSSVSCFKKGDILFGKLRPYLAKVLEAPFDGVGTTELVVIRMDECINSHFAFYQLLSDRFINLVNALTYGVKMPRANPDQIVNISICVPPIKEQKEISLYLDKESSKIDNIIQKIKENISLLEEYKKSLIHHVVTGKVDVREVAV